MNWSVACATTTYSRPLYRQLILYVKQYSVSRKGDVDTGSNVDKLVRIGRMCTSSPDYVELDVNFLTIDSGSMNVKVFSPYMYLSGVA